MAGSFAGSRGSGSSPASAAGIPSPGSCPAGRLAFACLPPEPFFGPGPDEILAYLRMRSLFGGGLAPAGTGDWRGSAGGAFAAALTARDPGEAPARSSQAGRWRHDSPIRD